MQLHWKPSNTHIHIHAYHPLLQAYSLTLYSNTFTILNELNEWIQNFKSLYASYTLIAVMYEKFEIFQEFITNFG